VVKRLGALLIGMTGGRVTLARHADLVLDSGVEKKPARSTWRPPPAPPPRWRWAMRWPWPAGCARLRAEDFALAPRRCAGPQAAHPCARRDAHGEAVPRRPEARLELMREMSAKGLGASAVVDEAGAVLGIFTDGDLRRLIEHGAELRGRGPRGHAPRPRRIRPDALAVDAASLMEQHSITSVLVCEPDTLVGIVHIGDLMRAKVI
jgi:arabinose-5-phosphate isomerase